MQERDKASNDELIKNVPQFVLRAFDHFDLEPLELNSEEHLLDLIFSEPPKTDIDSVGWLWFLGVSVHGYFKQLGSEVNMDHFVNALQSQLEDDYKRWGDTWKKRTIEGQLDRSYKTFKDYGDQYKNANQPIPWLKVAGNVIICLTRLDNPNYQK